MTEAAPVPLPMRVEEEKISSAIHTDVEDLSSTSIDPAIERRVVRKCDIRVVPPTLFLFMLSFIDRVNIGNARIQGLEADLDMHGTDFNVALLMVFIPFILLEIPSNLMMKRLGPSTWLSILLAGCGIMSVCQGVVSNYSSLVACRFILGIFEAGLGPGSIYLISMYYRRYELPKRIAWWYLSGLIAGAFGGLLAYAIANMSGIAGYNGWRWILIIEGLFTFVIGVGMKFVLVDWPETASFLTEEERRVLIARLKQDKREEAQMNHLDRKTFLRCLSDWKIWVGTLTFLGIVNLNYASSFFIPTILRGLGYTAAAAQVRSIPIYVVPACFCLASGYLSDRVEHRYGFIMAGVALATIGLAVLLVYPPVPIGAAYMALFFVVSGGYIVQPLSVSWLMNNCGGHYKRAVAAGAQIGFGNAGGIVGSNIFLNSEAPRYRTGYGTSLALLLFAGTMSTVMLLGLMAENQKRARGKRDDRYSLNQEELDNLGDDHPAFRYTY